MKQPAILVLVATALLATAAVTYHVSSNGSQPDHTVVEEFQAAHHAATNGDLEEAIADYQALIDEGHQSASAYYNLASAQHRVGDLGAAILNYERAALLDPGAGDIAANLARARKDAAVPDAEPTGWHAFLHSLAPNAWSIIAALSLLGLVVLAAIPTIRRGTLPTKSAITGAACALLAIGLSVTALAVQARDTTGRRIVMKNGTPLRVSPFADAKAVATLPAGKTVIFSPRDPHDGYRLARLKSGQSGWVTPGEVQPITEP